MVAYTLVIALQSIFMTERKYEACLIGSVVKSSRDVCNLSNLPLTTAIVNVLTIISQLHFLIRHYLLLICRTLFIHSLDFLFASIYSSSRHSIHSSHSSCISFSYSPILPSILSSILIPPQLASVMQEPPPPFCVWRFYD